MGGSKVPRCCGDMTHKHNDTILAVLKNAGINNNAQIQFAVVH